MYYTVFFTKLFLLSVTGTEQYYQESTHMNLPASPFFDQEACLTERAVQGEFFDQLIS